VTLPEPPEIPDETLESTGWRPVSEETDTTTKDVLGAFEFEVYMHTKKYENNDGDGIFFINKTRTEPSPDDLPLGVGEDRIAGIVKSRAIKKLKDELEHRGVRGMTVEEERDTETEAGEVFELERLEATYQGTEVRGWAGVVRRDDYFLTAGGVCPTAEGENTREQRDLLRLAKSAG
jgi:hypothetical protein